MHPDYLAPTMYDPLVGLGPREIPREFRIFRAGQNETTKGTFLFDEEAGRLVLEAYAKRGLDMTMDYEHQSLCEPPIEAPNSATRIVPQVRNGELWATDVKWTDRALSYLYAGEYRYFSPAFEFDPKTGRVTRLINVALTNNPATHGIAPLVAATDRKDPPPMDYQKMYEELKAKFDAQVTELAALRAKVSGAEAAAATAGEEVGQLTAVVGLRSDAPKADRLGAVTALATLRSNLVGITGAKNDAELVGTIAAWKENAAAVATLTDKLAKIEAEKLEGELGGMLDAAAKDGKLAPAKKDEIRQIALRVGGGKLTADGVATARTCLSLLGPQVTTTDTKPGPVVGALDPMEIEIAMKCGRDPNELLERKRQQQKGA